MNCGHRLTPDPRSGIRFCANCGMDERNVRAEQNAEMHQDQIDEAVLDAILDANLNPRLCVIHSADLIKLGRAVWDKAVAARRVSSGLTDEEKADCGLLPELDDADGVWPSPTPTSKGGE